MLARAEAFERHNVAPDAALDRDHAGTRRDAVDQHGAGAAFAEAAAVFRSVQCEIVAQHVKQRGIGRGVDVVNSAVDGQADRALRHDRGLAPAVALQNVASNLPAGYRLYTNVQAGHAPCKIPCPVYEQTCEANCAFNRQRRFSRAGALDSFSRHAQHRSYTNKMHVSDAAGKCDTKRRYRSGLSDSWTLAPGSCAQDPAF